MHSSYGLQEENFKRESHQHNTLQQMSMIVTSIVKHPEKNVGKTNIESQYLRKIGMHTPPGEK